MALGTFYNRTCCGMAVKTTFNPFMGGSLILEFASPMNSNDPTSKYDWRNSVMYSITHENAHTMYLDFVDVCAKKKEQSDVYKYTNDSKMLGFAFKNGNFAISMADKQKNISQCYVFNSVEELKTFMAMLKCFVEHAFLANMILDGITEIEYRKNNPRNSQGGGYNQNQGGGYNQNQGGGYNQGGGGFNQNQNNPQNQGGNNSFGGAVDLFNLGDSNPGNVDDAASGVLNSL